MAETETLDKIYLEWSQFTKARTSRELAMADMLDRCEWWLSTHPEGREMQKAIHALFVEIDPRGVGNG
ncbi:MAG: hypothetical protein EOS58_30615 [Mesorhizobium sp.]|nr:MAG: hypothetical protein EOS58_30615 [Mesorhizobium sp.]